MEQALRSRILSVLRVHDVRLGYLFGSRATGKSTGLSDVDLGVSFAAGDPT